MSFISKLDLQEDRKKAGVDGEIALLIKARGFEPGFYKFIPSNQPSNVLLPKPRPADSIMNGEVKGSFSINEDDLDTIVFERNDFSESAWKKICARLGFKFHIVTDIDKFTIVPNSIDVNISIATPKEEV